MLYFLANESDYRLNNLPQKVHDYSYSNDDTNSATHPFANVIYFTPIVRHNFILQIYNSNIDVSTQTATERY